MSTADLINQVRHAPSHKLAHELTCAKRILVARGITDAGVTRFVEFSLGLRAKDRLQMARAS